MFLNQAMDNSSSMDNKLRTAEQFEKLRNNLKETLSFNFIQFELQSLSTYIWLFWLRVTAASVVSFGMKLDFLMFVESSGFFAAFLSEFKI